MGKTSVKEAQCPFCRYPSRDIIGRNEVAFAVYDNSPVTRGHILILPRRHCEDFFALNPKELCGSLELIERLKKKLIESDPKISGFNIGINCGETAGQTIFHAHIHLIPRRKNDTPNPRGGVRGVIPEKMNY